MKKLIAIASLAFVLSGCATISNLQLALTTTVTPTEALVAANAFDAAQAGATAYLTYCQQQGNVPAACSAANRRGVISYVRSGRKARSQVEGYIVSSTSVPAAIYNALITAVSGLRSTQAASYTGVQ
jgi:hypothetical protein